MTSLRNAFFAFSCLVLINGSLAAQELRDLPAMSADPKALLQAASAIPRTADTDAVILFEDFQYKFDADGKYTASTHRVVQVITQEGVSGWSSISSQWAPWQESRPVMRARVINPDGSEHLLEQKNIADSPVRQEADLLNDRRALKAPLPAMVAGSVIETETVVRLENNLFGAGSVTRIGFGGGEPVASTRVILDAPVSLSLKTESKLLPKLKSSSVEQGGRVRKVFEQGELEAPERAPANLPSDVPAYPYLAFSTGQSWKDTATKYAAVVERQIAAGDVRSLVTQTLKGEKDPVQIGRLLLARLHKDVRYTGVEFDESALTPATPTETLKRKFGDCKDKAATYAAMLRAAGIPAYLALLSMGPGHDVSQDLPGLGEFDHVIVHIPGTPERWVDATADTLAFGSVPTVDQGRWALIVRPETTAVVRIPETPSGRNLLHETREFTLSERGKAKVVETTHAWDDAAADLRAEFEDTSSKRAKDMLTAYARNAYSSEKLVSAQGRTLEKLPAGVRPQDPAMASAPDLFELKLVMDQAQRGFTAASDAVVAFSLEAIANRLPAWLREEAPKSDKKDDAKAAKKRTADVELPFAFVTEWDYVVHPPVGYQLREGFKGEDLRLGPARLTQTLETSPDGTVMMHVRFDTGKRRYTAEEAEALRAGLVELGKRESSMISFDQKGSQLLQSGKVREAIGEFRTLIRLHPTEALHHTQMTTALLRAGAGEAARREAREAVRLEPNSALAHYTLGFTLLNDLVGREFRPGMDLAGGEKAYRKAKELEPDNIGYRQELALLLEHDSRGVRYSAKAKLKEAIAEYAEVQDKLEDTTFANNILVACLRAGDFKTLFGILDKYPMNANRRAIRLAALARTKGTSGALEEAGKYAQDERRAALDLAGQLLLIDRRYPEASALLNGMGVPSSNAATANLLRAGILNGLKRAEDIAINPADPTSVVRSFFRLVMSEDSDAAAFMALLSTEAQGKDADKTSSSELIQVLRAGRGPVFRQFAQLGLPPEMIGDLLGSATQFTVAEDHDGGYLVSTSMANSRSAFFVVRQNNRFVITGMKEAMPETGVWITKLLDEKRFKTARIWLDWSRDLIALGGGDDQFAGPLFPRLWAKDEPSGKDEERRMRNAALSMGLSKENAASAVVAFRAALGTVAGDAERELLNLALARALVADGKFQEAVPVAAELWKAHASSDELFSLYGRTMMGAKRFDEVEKQAQERAQRFPSSTSSWEIAQSAALYKGDFQAAQRYIQKVIDSGKATQSDWNQLGWHSLFLGKADAATTELVLKNTTSGKPEPGIIHTLAALLAETGKTTEAREQILLAMDLWGLDEPNDQCWVVFGRIAEQFGLNDVAMEDYRKIEQPKDEMDRPSSSWALAQIRLKGLGGK